MWKLFQAICPVWLEKRAPVSNQETHISSLHLSIVNNIYGCILSLLKFLHKGAGCVFGSKARQGSVKPTCELKIFLLPCFNDMVLCCSSPVPYHWNAGPQCHTQFTVSILFSSSPLATAAVHSLLLRFFFIHFNSLLLREQHKCL